MGFAAIAAAVVGAFFLAQVDLIAAGGWFFGVISLGIFLYLDKIANALEMQRRHNEWIVRIEAYRFDHDHPDAAAVAEAKELARVEAQKRQTQDLFVKQEAEKAAKAEAKRRAKEPTFVAVEAVPDVPADFRTKKKPPSVDFSAIEEVSKPRRKSP
jgi:high-affinity K+ transport system ATPase subunit B